MIKLNVNAVNEGERIHVISHGKIEGNGEEVLYEMFNVIKEFDSICNGKILADALEMWLDDKGVE